MIECWSKVVTEAGALIDCTIFGARDSCALSFGRARFGRSIFLI